MTPHPGPSRPGPSHPLHRRAAERPLLAPEAALSVVTEVLETMERLEALLESETRLVKEGRIGEALSHEAEKANLATAYMQGLEQVKANALTLTRSAPERIADLKAAHGRFARAIETNQAVLATARAVSEGLMRALAVEAGITPAASGYAPGQPQPGNLSGGTPSSGAAPRLGALVLSKSV